MKGTGRGVAEAAPRSALRPRRRCTKPFFHEPHPHRPAEGYQLVVEVVARVVQHARSLAVAGAAVAAIAVADDEVTARLFLQEVAEVLGTHRRLELPDVVRSGELAEQLAREVRLAHVIDRRGVVAFE